MKKILLLMISLLFVLASCNTDNRTYAMIETDMGNIKVLLYDDTPLHKENFIKLANEKFYDDLLFHRVIKGFMMQGGDPESRGAAPGQRLGSGGPGYRTPAEFGHLHFKGALAAARDGNPDKKSSGSQFYIVQGNPLTDAEIRGFEMQKGIQLNDAQRAKYIEMGGAPFLDMEYTVFGEVVEGLDVVDEICNTPVMPGNRPKEDIKMKIRIL